jgi:(p)ppGpp synthase/HD superfamily hydrolase
MHEYAQTNLQLYNQMRRAGYSGADLAAVRAAYDLGTTIFTGAYRGSGKPLLAHLVGTASVLVSLGAPVRLVAAAVLHAAYMFGEFGDGRRNSAPFKRSRIRAAAGPEVESLIARYDTLRWDERTIPSIEERMDRMSAEDRDALLIRLANELEDHIDLGVLYCGNAAHRRAVVRSNMRAAMSMARKLGHPRLAAEFERVFAEILATDVPAELQQPHDYSYTQAPLSHAPRAAVRLRGLLDRHPRLALLRHPTRLLAGVRRLLAPQRRPFIQPQH